MIGVFAIHGERVYFNEMLLKGNFQPCAFPLENWFLPKRKQLFIPLNAAAVTILDVLGDEKFTPDPLVAAPELCGILICANTKIYEVGMGKDGKPAMKRVPVIFTNPTATVGVRYVRSQQRDLEDSFTAALRITDDLEKANELMRKSTLSVPGTPVYTQLGQLIWAAVTQDSKVIRAKMTRSQLQQHVKKTLPGLLTKAKKTEERK